MFLINRKLIIIIVSTLIIVIVSLIIIGFLTDRSKNTYAKRFQDIAIDNQWGTQKDFNNCQKNSVSCIPIATSLIKQGLLEKATLINYDLSVINNDFSKIETFNKDGNYEKSYNLTQTTVSNVEQKYNKYVAINKENFNSIDKVIRESGGISIAFKVINYKIIGDWAGVILIADNNSTEAAGVILKKESGNWQIIIGPGTSFDESIFAKYQNIPNEIKDIIINPKKPIIINN